MPKPTKPVQPTKNSYVANANGWTAGQWRAKGSPLELTEEQAKYENVTLVPEEPAKAAPAKGSAAKK